MSFEAVDKPRDNDNMKHLIIISSSLFFVVQFSPGCTVSYQTLSALETKNLKDESQKLKSHRKISKQYPLPNTRSTQLWLLEKCS